MRTGLVKLGDAIEGMGIITKRKYEHLLKFEGTLSDKEKKMISDYEAHQLAVMQENYKKLSALSKPKKEVKKIEKLSGDVVFENFKVFWSYYQKKELILNESNHKVIYSLCQYFGKDDRCLLDLNKGILLSGDCGVGKTTMMTTFHLMGKSLLETTGSELMWFQMINCNDLVEEFESEETESGNFHKQYKTGNKYFDDFGTERIASKYGKSNLMQEILEKRYLDLSWKTYLTSNLSPEEINGKYGFRVYDRLFEQFNYIELTGDSFRRIA